jgi:glutamate/tyrosine decarboxylase-like PLP-dependent enzyme
MHAWDERTELLAHSVLGYAIERLKVRKDPHWGAKPADVLNAALAGTVCAEGIGGHQALQLFRDLLMPATRPLDDPLALAYVPTAPAPAATLFDLVVSASSIFAGHWESGAGAIAAENQALGWLADLAGLPAGAGGCFVSGGSAANLSALVAARHHAALSRPRPDRWRVAATDQAHSSVRAAAKVMDVDVVAVATDDRGRMTGTALREALDGVDGVFAVVANGGSTNVGAVDALDQVADACEAHELWLHVDGAYGLAALCAPSARRHFIGIERVDSFGVDPHKWLFAPYDCAALVYRNPALGAAAHCQHAEYLDAVDHAEWNPSDYAYHLSRRARGLSLWFALATYGTKAFSDAVETTLDLARRLADEVCRRAAFELLLEPQLSVVVFEQRGWVDEQYQAWSHSRAKDGVALVVPTKWEGRTCWRMCIVNPLTTLDQLIGVLDDMSAA